MAFTVTLATIMSIDSITTVLTTPMQLGESPLWNADEQCLYWIDIPAQQVHRLHPPSGAHRIWPLPSEPGCIARCATGGLVVAMRTGIAQLDTNSGKLSPIVDAPYDMTNMRFNDGRCDASGRLWVGTLYEPRDRAVAPLFQLEHNNIIDSGNRATVSNGIAFSIDNRTLYHSDTTAHKISTYDFDVTTGSINNGRVFQQFSTDRSHNYGGRPDGATVDSENAYWCAMFEGGRLLRFSANGDLLEEIRLPVRCPTMMAFGGSDLRTLYITSARHNRPIDELRQYPLSGFLLAMQVDIPGRPEYTYVL